MIKEIFRSLILNLSLILSLFSTTIYALPTDGERVVDQGAINAMNNILNTLNNNIYPAVNSTNSAVQAQTQVLQQSLTGTNSLGAMFNSASEQDFRNWTPTAEDLQNMVQQGLQTGSLTDQIKYYNQKFPIPHSADITPHDTNSTAGHYAVFAATSTNAAFAIADKSFNRVQDIMSRINFLYSLIDRQQNLKQGVDLNSVILVKIASLQTELIRLQAAQLKMQAVNQQQNNNTQSFMTHFIQDMKE